MILDSVLQDKPDQEIGQGYQDIVVYTRRKSRGEYMLKSGRNKEG